MARTLLLDLDGTLVDTVPDIAAALNRLMAARSLAAFPPPEVASMVGDGVAVLISRAFAARGVAPDQDALKAFAADYEANVAVESRLFPHVLPVLEGLARDGWQFAVCTNKPERASRTLLAALGILPMLRAVGGGDSFPARKPDPAHLLATLAQAHGAVEQALMLGDHRNDVLASGGAGIRCIYAAWGYGAPGMGEGSAAVARDMIEAADLANQLLPRFA
nr:HAD hydrolase-like protein [uncultured Rhodopila sp.]